MCERMTLPPPSLSVRTIMGDLLASVRIRAAFSFFLKTPKPSVLIINQSQIASSFILSYLPSTIIGYAIFNLSIFKQNSKQEIILIN